MARPWTEDDDDALRKLRAEGYPLSEIARVLERTPEAAKCRAVKIGARAPQASTPWTAAEERRLLDLRRAGVPRARIAQELQRTPSAVKQRLSALGVGYAEDETRRPWSLAEKRRAVAWRRSGVPRREIARRLNRTPEAVKHVLVAERVGFAAKDPRRPWAPQDRQLVVELRQQGLKLAEIAARVDRSRAAVSHILAGNDDVPEPPIDLVTDREARLQQLSRQIVRRGPGEWHCSGYVLPDVPAWVQRFTERPELVARIVHDVVSEAMATEGAFKGRKGRRPEALDRRLALAVMPQSLLRALDADGILVGRM